MDYYDILGVQQTASSDDIKTAYRKLSLKNHPDMLAGLSEAEQRQGEENFKKISVAYATLSDSEKRMKYDQFGHDPDNRNTFSDETNEWDLYYVELRRKMEAQHRLDMECLDVLAGREPSAHWLKVFSQTRIAKNGTGVVLNYKNKSYFINPNSGLGFRRFSQLAEDGLYGKKDFMRKYFNFEFGVNYNKPEFYLALMVNLLDPSTKYGAKFSKLLIENQLIENWYYANNKIVKAIDLNTKEGYELLIAYKQSQGFHNIASDVMRSLIESLDTRSRYGKKSAALLRAEYIIDGNNEYIPYTRVDRITHRLKPSLEFSAEMLIELVEEGLYDDRGDLVEMLMGELDFEKPHTQQILQAFLDRGLINTDLRVLVTTVPGVEL